MDVEFYNWLSARKTNGFLPADFLEQIIKEPQTMRMTLVWFLEENDEWVVNWIRGQFAEIKENFATEGKNAP